jgi:hypothetical protein
MHLKCKQLFFTKKINSKLFCCRSKELLDKNDDYEMNFIHANICFNLLFNKNFQQISAEKLKEYFLQSILKVI